MSKKDLQKFGKRLKALRLDHNLTQLELAEILDMSPNFIGMIERGERNTTVENVFKIKVNDDVVYLGKKSDFAGKIVTHEVIKIDKIDGNTYFHTKGIANDVEDPLVSADQIMGRVSFKSHILSFISRVVNNIYGFYFVIFVPFAILLVMEIIDIVYERREKKS